MNKNPAGFFAKVPGFRVRSMSSDAIDIDQDG